MTSTLIERSTRSGIAMQGGTLDAQRIIVRDTVPSPDDGLADGVFMRPGETGEACGAIIRGAVIEHNPSAGVFALGADARLENVLLSRTGWGAAAYYLPEHNLISQLALVDSQVVESSGFGVLAVASELEMTRTTVTGTQPSLDGRFGDGVTVAFGIGVPETSIPKATLRDSVIAHSSRAGLSSFGADVSFENIEFSCNALQINGESDYLPPEHHSFRFDDRGGNVCNCGAATKPCEVVTSMLEPPEMSVTPTVP
jgi:hypothetical protein